MTPPPTLIPCFIASPNLDAILPYAPSAIHVPDGHTICIKHSSLQTNKATTAIIVARDKRRDATLDTSMAKYILVNDFDTLWQKVLKSL